MAIISGVLTALGPTQVYATGCPTPAVDYGTVSTSISVPGNATYNVWSRIMAPDTINNTYALEIDGTSCYTVGGGNITPNAWTWVDYQNGMPTSLIQLPLTQGTHTLRLVGLQPNVGVDRIVIASDLTCIPTGTDGACNTPNDTTPPTVALDAPATASGTVTVGANASDNVGVTKVEFYVNSVLQATDTTAPYSFSWNTSGLSNDIYSVTAKAYDAAGNVGADTQNVSVQNADAQAPSAPTNVKAVANAYNSVTVTWAPSTDNVGVAGYFVYRDNSAIAKIGNTTSYTDTSVSPNTQYNYVISAYDAAGNEGVNSAAATVTTPNPPVADTQAPSAPTNLSASAVSPSQINLSWSPSTDNIGVTGYDVYRATGTNAAQKVATVTTTSYGDTGLAASTAYSYYVKAHDAAGNVSAASTTANATTMPIQTTGSITGMIKDSSGQPISGAHAYITINGSTFIYSADSQGIYVIPSLAPGTYKVSYRAKGYYPKSYKLTVTAGTNTVENVTLQKR